MPAPLRRLTLYTVFFISGLCGLGCQIVWTRMLGIGLGHELPAVLAVVAAFFGGLALGAWALDRAIGQSLRPGRWYAILEIVVGTWSVVLTFLLPLTNNWALKMAGLDPSSVRQWMVTFLIPFAALLPATFAMGATLPAMERFVAPFATNGKCVGGLYSLNTFGAVAGILASTILIMPRFGFVRSLLILAALNFFCGLVVLWLEIRIPSRALANSSNSKSDVGFGPLHLGLFLTGLLGIGFEVLGVRILSEVLENTIYSFAASLSVYLLGTAAGAGLYQGFGKSIAPRKLIIGLLEGLSLSCLLGGLLLSRAQGFYDRCRDVFGDSLLRVLAAEMAVAGSVFAVATLFMGATFSHLAQSSRCDQGGIGRALAWNTLGSALAPLVFGVLLLPMIGAKWSLVVLSMGYLLLVPLLLSWKGFSKSPINVFAEKVTPNRRARKGTSNEGKNTGKFGPWGRYGNAAAAGAFILPIAMIFQLPSDLKMVRPPPGGKILEYRHGVMDSVAVVEHFDGNRSLLVNNRFVMGGTGAADAARRHAHIPLLLHHDPKKALFLGLGTGISFAAAGSHPDLRAEGVELIPEIPDFFHYFSPHSDLRPGLRIQVADARRFVRATDEKYDVIVADLFHPARDGAGALYTIEHFQAIKKCLTPGGIFCQWLPLYQLDDDVLRVIIRTFLNVFPETRAFLLRFNVETPVLGLIASLQPTRYPSDWFEKRVRSPELMKELKSLTLMDAYHFFGGFVAGPEALLNFSRSAPLNTDDHPVVIFRAPEFDYHRNETPYGRLLTLLNLHASDPGQLLEENGTDATKAFDAQLKAFIAARDVYLRGLVMEAEGQEARAIDAFIESARVSTNFSTGYARCLTMAVRLAKTNPTEARRMLERLIEAQPGRPVASELKKRLFDSPEK